MRVFVDIETVANERADEYFAGPLLKVDKRLKTAETIEKHKAEAKEKAGLTWWTGKVCCIVAIPETDEKSFTLVSGDEKDLLLRFSGWLYNLEQKYGLVELVGKNVDEFDQPFLIGRAMAHSIMIPKSLSHAHHKQGLRDIDEIWGRYKNGQHGRLDDYAFGLGLPMKISHGSEVQGMFNEQKFAEIQEYCTRDTEIVRDIYNRWMEVQC